MYFSVTDVWTVVVWFALNVWSLNNWIEKAGNTKKSLKKLQGRKVCVIHSLPFSELLFFISGFFYVVHSESVVAFVIASQGI